MTPGRTQAVDSVANIRGRSGSGRRPADGDVGDRLDRAGAEALDEPGGDQDRHRRRQAADEQADREQPETDRERDGQPAAVDRAADDDDADQRAEEERREDPAVELEAAELVGDDRHDRRDRQRLEADEGDRQDEPERQRAPVRAPQAVVSVDRAGRCIRKGWRKAAAAGARASVASRGRPQAGRHSPSEARSRSTAAAWRRPSAPSSRSSPSSAAPRTGSASERRTVARRRRPPGSPRRRGVERRVARRRRRRRPGTTVGSSRVRCRRRMIAPAIATSSSACRSRIERATASPDPAAAKTTGDSSARRRCGEGPGLDPPG